MAFGDLIESLFVFYMSDVIARDAVSFVISCIQAQSTKPQRNHKDFARLDFGFVVGVAQYNTRVSLSVYWDVPPLWQSQFPILTFRPTITSPRARLLTHGDL